MQSQKVAGSIPASVAFPNQPKVRFINSIDEWATGVKVQIPFTTVEYFSVYQGHRKVLNKFEAFTKKHDLLEKICAKMYTIGR